LIVVAMFAADARADWTQFRGPMGQGKSEETGLPAEWTEAANVAWKTAVPGSGWSSPVVQGDQVWVTAAKRDGAALHALCFNADDGQLLHDVLVFEVADPDSINPKNTYASPTPVLS